MPLIIILFVLVIFNNNIQAQALSPAWLNSLPGNAYEQSNAVAVAPCGDVYIVGYFQQQLNHLTATGNEDGFIAKYTPNGHLIWLKQLQGKGKDRLNAIQIIDDNTIILGGEFSDTLYYNNDTLISVDWSDALVIAIDSSGQINWATTANGQGFDSVQDLVLLDNNTIVATGYFDKDLHQNQDSIYTTGLRDAFSWGVNNTTANTLWLKGLGGPGFDEGRSIASDGQNYYITGVFRDAIFIQNDTLFGNLGNDIFVAKYNNLGQFVWAKNIGGPTSDFVQAINVDKQNNIYITGWFTNTISIQGQTLQGEEEEDVFLIKLDSSGALIWMESIGYKFDERGYDVDFDQHDNVYLMATLDSFLIIKGDTLLNRHFNRPTDIFIAKFDANGQYKWAQTLGHYYNDFCYDMEVLNHSEAYITGGFQDTTIFVQDTLISQSQFDVFIGKIEMDTILAITKPPLIPQDFVVQVSPNPAKDWIDLAYQLNQKQWVQIELFDIQGRSVKRMPPSYQSEGSQNIRIPIRKLTQGIYLLQIQTANNINTYKIIHR